MVCRHNPTVNKKCTTSCMVLQMVCMASKSDLYSTLHLSYSIHCFKTSPLPNLAQKHMDVYRSDYNTSSCRMHWSAEIHYYARQYILATFPVLSTYLSVRCNLQLGADQSQVCTQTQAFTSICHDVSLGMEQSLLVMQDSIHLRRGTPNRYRVTVVRISSQLRIADRLFQLL